MWTSGVIQLCAHCGNRRGCAHLWIPTCRLDRTTFSGCVSTCSRLPLLPLNDRWMTTMFIFRLDMLETVWMQHLLCKQTRLSVQLAPFSRKKSKFLIPPTYEVLKKYVEAKIRYTFFSNLSQF